MSDMYGSFETESADEKKKDEQDITGRLVTTFWRWDFAKPQSLVGEYSLLLGIEAPTDTKAVLGEAGAARAALCDALAERPPDATRVIGAALDYISPACRLAATQLIQVAALGEAGKREDKKAVKPFVWTSVLDSRARSGIWPQRWAAFDIAYASTALAAGHIASASVAVAEDIDGGINEAVKHMVAAGNALIDCSNKVLTPWRDYVPFTARSPELLQAVMSAYGHACLGMAQQAAAHKALTTGKPKKLVARLYAGSATKYKRALTSIQTGIVKSDFDHLDSNLMEYITVMDDVCTALYHKYMGMHCYEAEVYNEAVVHLRAACRMLRAVRGLRRENANLERVVAAEANIVKAYEEQYTRENNEIYFKLDYPEESKLACRDPLDYKKPTPTDDIPDAPVPLDVGSGGGGGSGSGAGGGKAAEDEAASLALAAALQAEDDEAAAKARSGSGSSGAPAPVPSPTAVPRAVASDTTGYVKAGPPPPGVGDVRMTCASPSCRKPMGAPAGHKLVKCPACQSVNVTVTCGNCTKMISFLQGPPAVMCPHCERVNDVA